MKKKNIIKATALCLATILSTGAIAEMNVSAAANDGETDNEEFRIALSLGQDIDDYLEQGVKYKIGDKLIDSKIDLEKADIDAGATEMFVRIATKRYDDGDLSVDGYHAAIHNLETCLETCEIAAELDIPINPEIMCAYTYMDGFTPQGPDFSDYPEIDKPDKEWSEYTLDEMCSVLEQYGELVAEEVLATGCTVEYWNLGNEANFGFAGVTVGLETAVNPELATKSVYDMYALDHIGADYLKENVCKYNAQMMSALADGIKKVQPDAKFGTHVACQNDAYFNITYYNTLKEYGMDLDQAGISIYPTNEAANYSDDYMGDMKEVIKAVVEECDLPMFIAEYSYPTKEMTGQLDTWDVPVPGYDLSIADQARFTADFVDWCKDNGVSGIRPWGPDVLGDWEPMSFFTYDPETKIAEANPIINIFKD